MPMWFSYVHGFFFSLFDFFFNGFLNVDVSSLGFFIGFGVEYVSIHLFSLWCCCELQMWRDLIQKAKDGGLDVIQTYVFWNGHEPSPGKVNADYIFCSAITFDCIGCLVAEKG